MTSHKSKSLSGAVTVASTPMGEEKVIPATKRADGSLRKERKIKPGFIAQEDLGTFVPAAVAEMKKRQLPPGSVPGKIVSNVPIQKNLKAYPVVQQNSVPGSGAALKTNSSKKDRKKAKEFLDSVLNNTVSSSPGAPDVPRTTPAIVNNDVKDEAPSKESLEKKIRNTRKKLGQIEDLEKKQREGTTLIQEQLEKLSRKQILLDDISSLEKQIQTLSL